MALVFPSRLGFTPDHLIRVHDTAKWAVVTSTRLPTPDLALCSRYYRNFTLFYGIVPISSNVHILLSVHVLSTLSSISSSTLLSLLGTLLAILVIV